MPTTPEQPFLLMFGPNGEEPVVQGPYSLPGVRIAAAMLMNDYAEMIEDEHGNPEIAKQWRDTCEAMLKHTSSYVAVCPHPEWGPFTTAIIDTNNITPMD